MPEYEIVDWCYEHIEKEDLKSKETTEEAIIKLDRKGTAKLWMEDSRDWYADRNRKGKNKSLKGYVDDENANYIKEIQGEIEKANTEEELDKIDVDENYTEETVTELKTAIEDKKEELEVPITVEIEGIEHIIPAKFERGRPRKEVSAEVRATSGEIIEEIVEAGAENNLDRLRAIEIKNLPQGLKTFLEKERKLTISAVEEELKEGI